MKRICLSLMLIITLVSVLLFATLAHAATLEVGTGKPYGTIQSAINAAKTGDTVLVFDGTYIENISFNGKVITVRSANSPASTIINGTGSGSVVTFFSGEGVNSKLDGFTITNGTGSTIYYYNYGGGIFCSLSSPTITNCTISGNTAGYGGGIACLLSSPTIANCTITGNTATNFGGGIACEGSSPSPTITNCAISGNSAVGGGGIYCHDSSPTITNCTISGNTADSGGGIHCQNPSSPVITNCAISGNTATSEGGGINCYFESSPTITNCTISGNTAGYGGGIACYESYPTVKNTILWGDIASDGMEIYLDRSTITITYSDVEGGWTGEGNINADPLFVGNGNYHLTTGSPCIDKGTSLGAPGYDIDGDIRPQGIGYDIGSDEYNTASPTCSVWADVISRYNLYVSGQAQWNDVIACYNQYVAPK